MGIIVTLPPPRRKRAPAPGTASEATILLFMGVRYVRDFDDNAVDTVAPSGLPTPASACAEAEIA